MMRSFGARADTVVVDEPFYAHYLAATGIEHPGRSEVLASQPTDWRDVVRALMAPVPSDPKIVYQKHMTQHLLPDIDREWVGALTNAYLIRDPGQVVASYARVREEPTLGDLGYGQQVELHRSLGGPVVDARDVLIDPRGVLTALCAALGIPFDEHMLRWEPGRRDTDGVWAPHWYGSVERSTGFAPYREPTEPLPDRLRRLADAARPLYEELHAVRLTQ
jgi:hypothetical protein